MRWLEELDDTAFVAGVSMPLPLFDRNRGERDAARAGLRSARHERDAALATLSAEISAALSDFEARANEVQQLREQILPSAAEVFEGVWEGYAQGRFRGLDVIDAQRTLFELRLREIDALRAQAEARATISRLSGVTAPASAEPQSP